MYNRLRTKHSASGVFTISISPTGQFTLPAEFRRKAAAKGVRRFQIREVDPEEGTYLLEPLLPLGEAIARLGDRYLDLPPGVDLLADLEAMREEEAEQESR